MTMKEYFRRRSDILQKCYIGDLRLVAEGGDVVEVKQWHLEEAFGATSCPFCMVYLELDCVGCPVVEYGGKCGLPTSRRILINDLMMNNSTEISKEDIKPELIALIEEYNNDLDNGDDNGIV